MVCLVAATSEVVPDDPHAHHYSPLRFPEELCFSSELVPVCALGCQSCLGDMMQLVSKGARYDVREMMINVLRCKNESSYLRPKIHDEIRMKSWHAPHFMYLVVDMMLCLVLSYRTSSPTLQLPQASEVAMTPPRDVAGQNFLCIPKNPRRAALQHSDRREKRFYLDRIARDKPPMYFAR